ncbi:MAG TPA: zinc-ribbon domain-containing protein [Verrucomicrobiae bacterium]|nr:zinc-ribbon domain-containing protein [Verrucomicrobiae bacterium]
MTYCERCGMANPNNAIFCTGCGAQLQSSN